MIARLLGFLPAPQRRALHLSELPAPPHFFPRSPRPVVTELPLTRPARAAGTQNARSRPARGLLALCAAAALTLCALAFAGCGKSPLARGRSGLPWSGSFRVTELLPLPGGALVVTDAGAFRIALPRPGGRGAPKAGVLPLSFHDRLVLTGRRPSRAGKSLRSGECEHRPSPNGLVVRCPASDELVSFEGFPVTSAAEYAGRVFAGTLGGGLRALDSPERRLGDFPRSVTALTVSRGYLLCGSGEGLYLYDGRRILSLRLLAPDGRLAAAEPAGPNSG